MTDPTQTTYSIIHHKGQMSETVETGLTRYQVRDWLWVKAVEIGGWVSSDLIIKSKDSDESWAAVASE